MSNGHYYKYIGDPDALQSILRGAIKFTPIHELNDPSELRPALNREAVQASLLRLREAGYTKEDLVHLRRQERILQRLAPRFQAIRTPRTPEEATAVLRSPFYDVLPRLELLLDATAREISANVGLFCVSRRYESLPMWAHYAANATGLVIAFRSLDDVFAGDDTGVLRRPIAVRYDREHAGMTFEPASHETLFFEKFEDWQYEQEIRIVLPLAECRQEAFRGKPVHLYDIPMNCVAHVILGWNMPDDSVALVHQIVNDTRAAVDVMRARFVRGRIEVGA